MWYGIVIGFLFILNMFTSPFHWWWQWAAFGWGFGIVSHFAAVYGWEVRSDVVRHRHRIPVHPQHVHQPVPLVVAMGRVRMGLRHREPFCRGLRMGGQIGCGTASSSDSCSSSTCSPARSTGGGNGPRSDGASAS